MRPVPPGIVAFFVVCSALAAANAQPASFELSPFVGELYGGRVAPSPGPDPDGAGSQRLGDHVFGGLRAVVFPSPSLGMELELSRVTTAVTVRDLPCGQGAGCDYGAALDYALVLGVVRGTGRIRPYAELGGGVCRLTTLFGRTGGTRPADRATASAAVGADFAISEHVGVRLDARGYATDISGLDVGPICTTFPPAPPGGSVEPVPCAQDHWLRNAALSAGIVIRL